MDRTERLFAKSSVNRPLGIHLFRTKRPAFAVVQISEGNESSRDADELNCARD